jgi:hypothetical protein
MYKAAALFIDDLVSHLRYFAGRKEKPFAHEKTVAA